MKEYKVTLEFNVTIVDVEKQRKKDESEQLKQTAGEVHRKLLATKAAARRREAEAGAAAVNEKSFDNHSEE